MRLGLIGVGKVAQFHVKAARAAGFENIWVCSRDDSPNAKRFAAEHGCHYQQTLKILLGRDLDALVIAVPVEETLSVVSACIDSNLPILVEKPFVISSNLPSNILQNQQYLRVAYNRRCYSSVRDAKNLIREYSDGTFDVTIPELAQEKSFESSIFKSTILDNSVHVLDLVRFLFGDVEIQSNTSFESKQGSVKTIQVSTSGKFNGVIRIMSGVPENYRLNYWSPGLSLKLSPIESLEYNFEISKEQNRNGSQINLYQKKLIPWYPDEIDLNFKPGFRLQYELFKDFVKQKAIDNRLTTVEDALKTTNLAIEINGS